MALEHWLYLCLDQNGPIKAAIRQILSSSRSTALLGVLSAVGRKMPGLFNVDLREMVSLWRLQLWEEEYRIGQLESLMGLSLMQSTRWGEEVFNVARDWHALPHRKTTLGEVLLSEFSTNAEFRLFFMDIRAKWNEELATLADSGDARVLEKLTFDFDEHNWSLSENGIALRFVEPKERTQQVTDIQQENEQHTALPTFQNKCRRLLDEQRMMPREELEHFWRDACSFADEVEKARSRGEAPEDRTMEAVAVLVIFHDQWLAANPEREQWCSNQFLKAFEAANRHSEIHTPESASDRYWINFAAALIPWELVQCPSHQGIRALCADAVLGFNYPAVRDLMSAAFKHRERLGDDFRRLHA